MSDYLHSEITEKIIGAFYDVYNALGYGFLEKVYENALAIELRARGFAVVQQKPIRIHYRQQLIGEYLADVVINNLILLELKAARAIAPTHEAQLLNYLKEQRPTKSACCSISAPIPNTSEKSSPITTNPIYQSASSPNHKKSASSALICVLKQGKNP